MPGRCKGREVVAHKWQGDKRVKRTITGGEKEERRNLMNGKTLLKATGGVSQDIDWTNNQFPC